MPLILSNPNNRLQSELEIKEWERQRGSKTEDFPQIGVSRKELSLLKKARKDYVVINDNNKIDAFRLRELDFVKILTFDGGNLKGKNVIEIRTRGINYLSYLVMKKKERNTSRFHDFLMVAIGAVLGGAITYIFEHLSEIVTMFNAKQ